MPEPADQLAEAWRLLLDRRDSRDRWEGYVEEAEVAFSDLAAANGLAWTEAVEVASRVLGIDQDRVA